MCPQNSHVDILVPGIQNVTSFGNTVLVDKISKEALLGLGGPWSSVTGVLINGENLDTDAQGIQLRAESRGNPARC